MTPSVSVLTGFDRSVFDSPGRSAYSHKQWKTIAYANFRRQTECIMGGFEMINSSWGAWNVRRELQWVLCDDKNKASRVSKVSKTAKESFVKSYLGPL